MIIETNCDEDAIERYVMAELDALYTQNVEEAKENYGEQVNYIKRKN